MGPFLGMGHQLLLMLLCTYPPFCESNWVTDKACIKVHCDNGWRYLRDAAQYFNDRCTCHCWACCLPGWVRSVGVHTPHHWAVDDLAPMQLWTTSFTFCHYKDNVPPVKHSLLAFRLTYYPFLVHNIDHCLATIWFILQLLTYNNIYHSCIYYMFLHSTNARTFASFYFLRSTINKCPMSPPLRHMWHVHLPYMVISHDLGQCAIALSCTHIWEHPNLLTLPNLLTNLLTNLNQP